MSFTECMAQVNSVKIAYQLHGNEQGPVLLLIHGLSTPLTGWPSKMVSNFVEQGYRVLLVDNRDIGKSQLFNERKSPNVLWFWLKNKLGIATKPPYQLDDMKNDIVALLSFLNIEKVHVVGASMGGMIAQLLAIHHPNLVKTLTAIMSTTGDRTLPKMDKVLGIELAKAPKSNAYSDIKQYHINKWRVLGGEYYQADENELNDYVESMLERGITAKGTARQMLAVLSAKDRTPLLKNVRIPTLVLHGEVDMLLKVDCGKAIAKAIPNSQLKVYPNMGHDFPRQLIPEITQDIVTFTQQHTNSGRS